MVFCAFFIAQPDAYAQSNAPTKLKTEQGRKKAQKVRRKTAKKQQKGDCQEKKQSLCKNLISRKNPAKHSILAIYG
jgi:hypothetical protein